ncbi:MAG: 4-hydroxy-3-methylbut-2-enyl diphosphate reductase [Desulfovibrionaceae bacterium]|nr:4-hydroxy-3-methylbut-2-enyl diphosphate reductase [Desulfovibrionaceae bacterium]
MQVVRAKTAGFCMGVSLALKKLDSAISEAYDNERIYTLGPLIHNPQVLAEYEAKGVLCYSSKDQLQESDCVVIRAHGIPKQMEANLRASGARVIDATCPKVKKAQLAISHATQDGSILLLFGEADHPEVRGLISYAQGEAFVITQEDRLEDLEISPTSRVILASQTTQDREAFDLLREQAAKIYPNLNVLSTICDATRERQAEARTIAGKVDIMVVVGGRQSGNTRRLADVAALAGIETILVETACELDAQKFVNKKCVGLTAGASTPKNLIDQTEQFLAAL